MLSDVASYDKMIHKKELEISKRKELVEQMAMSDAVIQKNQMKEDKIDNKQQFIREELNRKIDYYRNEIRKKEEQFEIYKKYCLDQIEIAEQKAESSIKMLESQKSPDSVNVTDDKILKRLEIEVEQLTEERNNRYNLYLKENEAYLKNLQKERLEDLQMEEEKQRQEEHRKRELYLIEKRAEEERADRLAEEKRQRIKDQIQAIMKREQCDEQTAKDMYMYSLTKQGSQSVQQKQETNIHTLAKQIRLQYPQYKSIVSELDKEYTEKMIRLEGDSLVKFLETMKPLIEMKLKFEEDETLLDENHQEIYSDLTLDQQIECIKLKTKEKRYKYLEKLKKTRSDKINDSLGFV
jgi:hypothetical protein